MSSKRPRTPTSRRTPSSPSTSPGPSFKAARITHQAEAASVARSLLCTLPPTCNPPNHPTPLANTRELENHYATYHAHVCAETSCKCVFPEARLLELHQTECHDPIACVRKERGEKIFACHLASCNRMFATPKTRRLHLIQAHGYPNEYFFAVTNKGVGGLLKKWGEGASMIRGPWKSREHPNDSDSDEQRSENAEYLKDQATATQVTNVDTLENTYDTMVPQVALAVTGTTITDTDTDSKSWIAGEPLVEEDSDNEVSVLTHEDDLVGAMSSLSLVPSNIRFGRGASRGGFSRRSSRGNGHRRKESRNGTQAMDVDGEKQQRPPSDGVSSAPRTTGRSGHAMPVHSAGAVPNNYAPSTRLQAPPMPPRGFGRGGRGRFPGRARILLSAGRGARM